MEIKKRSKAQNSSEHLWFREIAEKLNDGGFTVQEVITMPISFTEQWVKEYMFLRIAKVMFDKSKSSLLTKKETSQCIEELNRALADRFALHVPFPNEKQK